MYNLYFRIGEKLPYPGDCHKYYVCLADEMNNGKFHVEVFDCGEWVYGTLLMPGQSARPST